VGAENLIRTFDLDFHWGMDWLDAHPGPDTPERRSYVLATTRCPFKSAPVAGTMRSPDATVVLDLGMEARGGEPIYICPQCGEHLIALARRRHHLLDRDTERLRTLPAANRLDLSIESRLLRSMALLAEPGPSVLDVATSVGFDSVSGFTRAFRRHTGETPSAYRRRMTTANSEL